jgi:hypothetical protein
MKPCLKTAAAREQKNAGRRGPGVFLIIQNQIIKKKFEAASQACISHKPEVTSHHSSQ